MGLGGYSRATVSPQTLSRVPEIRKLSSRLIHPSSTRIRGFVYLFTGCCVHPCSFCDSLLHLNQRAFCKQERGRTTEDEVVIYRDHYFSTGVPVYKKDYTRAGRKGISNFTNVFNIPWKDGLTQFRHFFLFFLFLFYHTFSPL